MRLSVLLVLLLCAACGSTIRPTISDESIDKTRYIFSDNYANHRLQQSRFTSAGGDIAYLDVGKGPALVMIHGVPTSSWLYRKMLVGLQQDFRVVAVDLLGYGNSDKPGSDGTNYSPQTQASYIEALLSKLNITDYNLVFHDMGGLVAWELVTRDIANNSAIKSLTILNTIISKQGFDYPKIKKGMMAKAMSDAYASDLSSAAILEMTFKNMGLSSSNKLSESECFGYVTPMREGADEALYDFFTGFDNALFTRLESQINGLSAYTGKAQVLWGTQDNVLTTKQLPQLRAALNINDEDVVLFENNSHFLPEEVPDKLVEKIRSFLFTALGSMPTQH